MQINVQKDSSSDAELNSANVGFRCVLPYGYCSSFGWSGGSEVKLSGAGPVYEITANCTGGYVSWLQEQNLYQNVENGDGKEKGFPVGSNCAAKFNIAGTEGWVCFNNGGSYEFDWANLKK